MTRKLRQFSFREDSIRERLQLQTYWRQRLRWLMGNNTISCRCWQEQRMGMKAGSTNWLVRPWRTGSCTYARHKQGTRDGLRVQGSLLRLQLLLSVLPNWSDNITIYVCMQLTTKKCHTLIQLGLFWKKTRETQLLYINKLCNTFHETKYLRSTKHYTDLHLVTINSYRSKDRIEIFCIILPQRYYYKHRNGVYAEQQIPYSSARNYCILTIRRDRQPSAHFYLQEVPPIDRNFISSNEEIIISSSIQILYPREEVAQRIHIDLYQKWSLQLFHLPSYAP